MFGFESIALLVCSFVASYAISVQITKFSFRRRLFQQVRSFVEGPDHRLKSHIPSFGGVGIFGSSMICFLVWIFVNTFSENWKTAQFGFVMMGFLGCLFGIGLLDDLLKTKNKKGVLSWYKFAIEAFVAFLISKWILGYFADGAGHIYIPGFNVNLEIGYTLHMIFIIFVIVGSMNAFNLADGLDGLMSISGSALAFYMSFLSYTSYDVPSEMRITLSAICLFIAFALMGFLWLNAYPASIFMGDCGSLFVGGALGIIACMIHKEFLFGISASFFILETISSLIQTIARRVFDTRFFAYAPLHHHWESNGVHESKIVIRSFLFTIVMICVSIALDNAV